MKSSKVCTTTKSPVASLLFKGLATNHKTLKWSIASPEITKKYVSCISDFHPCLMHTLIQGAYPLSHSPHHPPPQPFPSLFLSLRGTVKVRQYFRGGEQWSVLLKPHPPTTFKVSLRQNHPLSPSRFCSLDCSCHAT